MYGDRVAMNTSRSLRNVIPILCTLRTRELSQFPGRPVWNKYGLHKSIHRRLVSVSSYFSSTARATTPCVLGLSHPTRRFNILLSLRARRTQDEIERLWTE